MRPLGLGVLALLACGCEQKLERLLVGEPAAAFDPASVVEPAPVPAGTAPLRFGVARYFDRARQEEAVGRVALALGRAVGAPVQATVIEGYDETLAGLRAGELEVAQLSPWACATAPDDVELFAAAIAQGSFTYQSYLVVRRDSPLAKVEDLRGARFAVSSRRSVSSFLFPRALLARRGLSLEGDLTLVDVASHDAALDALLAGEVDVAAPSSDTLVARGVLRPMGPVRILAQAARIPFDCVAVRRGALSEPVLARVRYAFLTLSALSPEGQQALSGYMTLDGFFPAGRAHYAELAKAIDLAGQ